MKVHSGQKEIYTRDYSGEFVCCSKLIRLILSGVKIKRYITNVDQGKYKGMESIGITGSSVHALPRQGLRIVKYFNIFFDLYNNQVFVVHGEDQSSF